MVLLALRKFRSGQPVLDCAHAVVRRRTRTSVGARRRAWAPQLRDSEDRRTKQLWPPRQLQRLQS